ncbi:MAG TPA: hypothetical protein VHX65_05855 [Pirellulales bacterium]|jgi:hypothetical protein|nr:hypothetical protein [Pirellulales bacterium]
MIPDRRFVDLPKHFWANIRTISQHLGYTARGTGQIAIPTVEKMGDSMVELGLSASHLVGERGSPTKLGRLIHDYFKHRAAVLNLFVEPRLMDVERAKAMFEKLQKQYSTKRVPPMNKQKGEKKAPAYFTNCINMLIEANAEGLPCDYDPRELTTVTFNNAPLRTLARRVGGAFPAPVNPIAVWEIKEYYYTTTFGSRVADGVYESLLDGMELDELRHEEKIDVKHYLMVDSHSTWWKCGRSYLCRILDMLHMGYVDEVLFGSEIEERLPSIVRQWVSIAKTQ